MAALMIAANPTEVVKFDAPYDLGDEAAAEWRGIIASMPVDHFSRGSLPMLAQLCRHIVSARRVGQLIEQCVGEKDLKTSLYHQLLTMQATETGAILRLCRSMRLSQQAIYRADATRRLKPVIEAPWHKRSEDGEDQE